MSLEKKSRRPRPPGCEKVRNLPAGGNHRKRNAQIRKSAEKSELFKTISIFLKMQRFLRQDRSFWYIFRYLAIPFDPPSRLVSEKIPGRRLFFQVRAPLRLTYRDSTRKPICAA